MAAAAPLALLLAALLLLPAPARAAPAKAEEDNPLPCQCTDVDPRTTFIEPAQFTCWQQYKFGQCGQDFIKATILEIPEGYCQITCGSCTCCPPLLNATLSAGLSEFAWALGLSAAANRTEDPSQPGLMMTYLAPNDNAMRDLFAKLGGKERILSDPGVRDKLGAIMDLHQLPPLNSTRAVWTSPFLLPGARPASLAGPGLLEVSGVDAGTGAIAIRSPGSTAKIGSRRDVYACKGFVNELDWYLLPRPDEFSK
ncbi:hypothetical protein Rsub_09638 [Raphidocelis subcapitata]|uniref:FAS1 domain-containing protein n=1 Tax=Raphidocelis subcapitata TaxID=307507 RepID=A0A2V0PCV1_9CHLO|nr:hypothetical protein Rsub_09638 [Raphidocelis subcapitata]|eukprot:GBF96782.1 hypothetical protein Rsub_09638 [Raphidocelis subcapitata]